LPVTVTFFVVAYIFLYQLPLLVFILWLKGFCFVRYAKKESAIWAKREKNGVEVTDLS
jgi:RNA recognition motif. (a.k.a. RRM, RBD, or RNP domain)